MRRCPWGGSGMLLICKETEEFAQRLVREIRERRCKLNDSADAPEIGGEDWERRRCGSAGIM